ncbi:MAG: ORC-CDC6 family AAA ATPase [Promethearchaeota archaeon]
MLLNFVKKLKNLSNRPNPIIFITESVEKNISEQISKKFQNLLELIPSFNGLIDFIGSQIILISTFIQELSLPNGNPIPRWSSTNINFVDEIIEIFKENIECLNNVNFFLLFDEFENLRPFQQTILIEWVKTAKNFYPKITSKFEGIYTHYTLQGQPLQFGQDCPIPIELDYNLLDHSKQSHYKKFLKKICKNLMEIEGWDKTEITEILPNFTELEVEQSLIDDLIKKIRIQSKLGYVQEKMPKYREQLQNSAIYRLLKTRNIPRPYGKLKIFAGFNTFTLLSSGIIRIFMNLVAMSVYKAIESGIEIGKGNPIPIEIQSSAVYVVSRGWLEKIPENYDFKEYGIKIYQLILDIGLILRERLLNHATEPETLCFTLTNPSNLNLRSNNKINEILCYAARESILYCRKQSSTIIPKSKGESKPKEFILNRIFSPVLRISHRTQWSRNHMSIEELKTLLDDESRQQTLKTIIARVKNEDIKQEILDKWMEKDE